MKRYGLLPGVIVAFSLTAVPFISFGRVEAGDRDALTAKLQGADFAEHSIIDQLKKSSDDQAVHALMKIVEERRDDWKLQIAAIRLLGEIANPLAVDLLIRVVTDVFFTNDCPALKWNGIVALGNFRHDPRVMDALLYRLNEDTLYLREAVIQSLGRIGEKEALPYLISALGDKHFSVKMNAIRALGEIEDPGAIPFLEKVVKSEPDPLLRDEALRVLGVLK